MRYLIDTQGLEWRVYERPAGSASPTPGRPSLIFDSDGIVRRLWRYPTDWSSLSDRQLLGLMESVRSPSLQS